MLNKKALIIQHWYFKLKSECGKRMAREKSTLNSSQIYFKPMFGLNGTRMFSNKRKSNKPPKVLKHSDSDIKFNCKKSD